MISTYDQRPAPFRTVTPEQWNDWVWQHQNRLKKEADFSWFNLTESERRGFQLATSFRVAVTPHYATLIDGDDPHCPVRQQALPQAIEAERHPTDLADPLAEEAHMPVPGITHRYPDRVLFYVSHHCPVYCRHCTRKRKVSDPTTAASERQIAAGLHYIRTHETVRDVLISGGDPLSLSNERLDQILTELRAISHVEVIRIGTRNPVTLPQRIDAEFSKMLRKHRPIYLHTHFNHHAEWTAESVSAIRHLLDAGCVLGNQMVLLKGVNDTPDQVMRLNRVLLQNGVRPYYMLQCDFAEGISHFRTDLSIGIEIMDHLRGRIGGMGVPDFVVDLPGGGGKVELVPDYLVTRNGKRALFRNYRGEEFEYSDR